MSKEESLQMCYVYVDAILGEIQKLDSKKTFSTAKNKIDELEKISAHVAFLQCEEVILSALKCVEDELDKIK